MNNSVQHYKSSMVGVGCRISHNTNRDRRNFWGGGHWANSIFVNDRIYNSVADYNSRVDVGCPPFSLHDGITFERFELEGTLCGAFL